MTSVVGRLYAFAASILVFCVAWAGVAAHPWVTSKPSAQAQLVALREQALRRETVLVNRILRDRAALRAHAAHAAKVVPGGARRHAAAADDHEVVMIARHRFHAMGTDVECLLDGEPGDGFAVTEQEFERLEALLSRFRPESELSRLNTAGTIEAGDDLLEVTRLALQARAATGGLFDPTVHDAVVGAGYDRSFELLAESHAAPEPARCGGGVTVEGRTIRLEDGVRLDLGGIAKGYAVDRAAALLGRRGPCLVNAGGDIAVRGGRWPVGVEGTELTVELDGGALATSGRDRRRWLRGGEEAHHLIDPATGRPSTSPLLRATVFAASATEAEVLAKVAFLSGRVDAPHVLVRADGTVVTGGGLR